VGTVGKSIGCPFQAVGDAEGADQFRRRLGGWKSGHGMLGEETEVCWKHSGKAPLDWDKIAGMVNRGPQDYLLPHSSGEKNQGNKETFRGARSGASRMETGTVGKAKAYSGKQETTESGR